jgi:hypothetical protein
VVSCSAADAPVAVLAVEGLVILGYLLLIGVPPQLGPWARGQVALVAAGVLASAAVLAAFAVRPSGSAWLALAGLAAAVAAYLVLLTDVTAAIEGRLRADSMGSRDEQ